MPNILACDTTQAACSVALAYEGEIISRLQPMSKGHAEALMPLLEEILKEAGIGGTDNNPIDYLCATHGPGTFTGVRVGLAALAGLALAWDKPLMPYGTLTAMMYGRHDHNETDRPIMISVDARRDTYYTQFFDTDDKPLCAPEALSHAQVLQCLTNYQTQTGIKDFYIMGSGKTAFAEHANFIVSRSADYPQAAVIVRQMMDWQDEQWQAQIPKTPAAPLYLRPPDATLPDKNKRMRFLDNS